MNKLEEARLIINDVDKQMIELFKKRMQAAVLVAEHKKENNLPIFDAARERALIEKNVEALSNNELETYYLEFFSTMLKVSKDYQKRLIDGDK